MKHLKKFVENPYVNIIVAIILLLSGLAEAWDTLSEDIMSGNFAAHHGVIIFGIFQVLKCIPDIFDGTKRLTKE